MSNWPTISLFFYALAIGYDIVSNYIERNLSIVSEVLKACDFYRTSNYVDMTGNQALSAIFYKRIKQWIIFAALGLDGNSLQKIVDDFALL